MLRGVATTGIVQLMKDGQAIVTSSGNANRPAPLVTPTPLSNINRPVPLTTPAPFAAPRDAKRPASDIKHQEKKDYVVIDIHPELYYLKNFTQQELEAFVDDEGKSFIKDHGKSVFELEAMIRACWKSQWYFRVENWFANLSNLLYVIFQINTSNEGVESFVQAFNPDAKVPSGVSYGVGVPTSILSTGLYTLAFSAYKEAIKSTLQYAYRKPLNERINDAYVATCASPFNALGKCLGYLFNKTTLLTYNLTGVMTEIVDIADKINALPTPLNWIVVTSILYFGNKYYEKYMDGDYYKGLKFWLNEENHPWLLGELARGNIATPLQILLQGASAVGLCTYPFYYYLALASATALGGWFPAPMVAAFATWHNLCALYPESYRNYMEDKIEVTKLIKAKIAPLITLLRQQNPELDEAEIEAAALREFEKIKEMYKAQILQEQGSRYVFREPLTAISIALRTAIGGYLGWQSGVAAIGGAIAPPIGLALIGGIFGGMLYRAEAERIMNRMIRHRIESEDGHAASDEKKAVTRCESASDAFAALLNGVNGVSGGMSMIGTGARLLGSHSSPALTAIELATVERELNTMKFNGDRVRAATRDLLVPAKSSSSSVIRVPAAKTADFAAPNALFTRRSVPESVAITITTEHKIAPVRAAAASR